MKILNKKITLTCALLMSCLLLLLNGCSTMQATNSGMLTKNATALTTGSQKIAVSWHVDSTTLITTKEQRSLNTLLVNSLESELIKIQDNNKLSNIRIRAAVTRVETVSEPLNWLSTIVVFMPLDRGGVAVEFEAFDITTRQSVAQLNFAQWTPMSEFIARFDRMSPAEIGMTSAANVFVTQLQKKLSIQ